MSSQLNVDTIVDKAGSGGTNVKIANTSVTVAEGGSGTTKTVQGLIKAWSHNSAAGTTIEDSFNIASLTDTSTGVQRNTFTSAMSNATYSAGLSAESSSESVSQWIEDINSARYDTRHYDGSSYVDILTLSHVQGDLA